MTTHVGIVTGSGEVLSSTYKWDIDNYSSHSDLETGKCVRSPSFNVERASWHIKLFPNGLTEEGYISLFLYLDNNGFGDTVEIQLLFAFSLINNKKEVIATNTTGNDYHTILNDNIGHGRIKLIKSLEKNYSNEKITVVLEIIIKEASTYRTILMPSMNKMQHFESFKNLINNDKFSDVKFTVQSKEIHAHKMVVAANSTVFAAMFEHKMRENEENNVVIEDINYEVFNELLHFMYTGDCTLNENITSELFEAADKYQLLQLKKMCEEELCKSISEKNVMNFLKLADMHSAERLKKEAIDFIALHGKEMIDKPEFESVGSFDLNLLKDVFRGIFANKN